MLLVHILRSGNILFPPFPAEQIPALLRSKAVLLSDLFWHDGMTQWEPVDGNWLPAAEVVAPPVVKRPRDVPVIFTEETDAPPAASRLTRWDRPSLLQFSERRYRETASPWGAVEAHAAAM